MIKEFRKTLGISQLAMAQHLGISRSQLAMIESGKRELANDKFNELLKLQQIMNEQATGKESGAVKSVEQQADRHQERQELIRQEIWNYRYKLERVRRRLKKMKASQERFLKLSGSMDDLLAAGKQEDKMLLSLIEADMKKQQEEKRAGGILPLEIQECGYAAILHFLEKQVEN